MTPLLSEKGPSPGAAAQVTAMLLAAAREGSEGWFVTGRDAPLSHSATFAFSSCKTQRERCRLNPFPLESAKKCIHAEGHHTG